VTENTKTEQPKSTPEPANVESSFLNGLINQSGKIDKLAGALAKAQSEMKGAQSKSSNPFFKSSYADLHTVIESSIPYLSKNGLSIVQGNRYGADNGFYVTTTLLHESGQWMRSEIRMPIGGKKDAHAVGGAMTYGRRYGLSAMVGIAQFDDDGNHGVKDPRKPAPAPKAAKPKPLAMKDVQNNNNQIIDGGTV
jgi:hypothetical protein